MDGSDLIAKFWANGGGAPQPTTATNGVRVVHAFFGGPIHQRVKLDGRISHGRFDNQVRADVGEKLKRILRRQHPLIQFLFAAVSGSGGNAPGPPLLKQQERCLLRVGYRCQHGRTRSPGFRIVGATNGRIDRAFTIKKTGCVLRRDHMAYVVGRDATNKANA